MCHTKLQALIASGDVDAAEMGALGAVDREEAAHFIEDPVERAGLEAA